MELRSFSQLHYIRAVKNGSVVKAQNIFKGRPSLKYKILADVYASEDANKSGLDSEVKPMGEYEIKVELPCPAFVERRTREIDFDIESDDGVGHTGKNESDDSRFSMMTLKEIMRRCKSKKRKRSYDVHRTDESVRTCFPSEFSHSEYESEDGMDDHEVPLSNWKNKLKSKIKNKKKKKNKSEYSLASSAIIVKSEPYQDDEGLQLSVVDDLRMPDSVKIEPLEFDYSDCRSLVCIPDDSSFTADEDADYSFSIDPKLPISFIEESQYYPLTLVPHNMDGEKPDTICYDNSWGHPMDAEPLKVNSYVSELEIDEYANHTYRDEHADTASAESTSGCDFLHTSSSNDEMPGSGNRKIQVQVPNTSFHVSDSHMLSSADRECFSSHTVGDGISHPAVYDSSSSDSEVCNRSSPTKDCSVSWKASLSVSHEIHNTSNSLESGEGLLLSSFGSAPMDDVISNHEAVISRSPLMEHSPPFDSAVNGTCPTAKDCSSSGNLNLPASSESCIVSVESNSPVIKDQYVLDDATKKFVEMQPHDDTVKLRHPQRLLSTRKIISPGSQKRLRQILECIDLEDDEDYKCREKLCAGDYTPDKTRRAEQPYPYRKFEMTVNPKLPEVKSKTMLPEVKSKSMLPEVKSKPVLPEVKSKPVLPEVKSKPKLIMKKPREYVIDTLPKDTIEISRHSRRMPDVSTGCDSIKSWSQSAIEFSQRQMNDTDRLALRLLEELKFMKDVFDETMQSGILSVIFSKFKTDKVQMAIKNATKVEETSKKLLSTMTRDCHRFCKIMALTGESSASTANTAQRERKIKFADEAGEELCRYKVFEADR